MGDRVTNTLVFRPSHDHLATPSPFHPLILMPPQFLFDISGIDLDKVLFDQEAIRELNPQRGDMEHLNAIVFASKEEGTIVGYKDVKDDEFWVPGHIPGRPLLPGVIMIESGAQLSSFYTRKYVG